MPKSIVKEDAQLTILGEIGHRFFFPNCCVALDVAAHLGRQHEKSAVDKAAVSARLFLKARDPVTLKIDGAKPARWLGCGDRRKSSFAAVESNACGYVDIRDAVAIGQAKVGVFADVGKNLFDP